VQRTTAQQAEGICALYELAEGLRQPRAGYTDNGALHRRKDACHWRQLTEDDTVNGTLLIVSIVLAALALIFLCVREMPRKKETHAAAVPVPGARLPLVSAA